MSNVVVAGEIGFRFIHYDKKMKLKVQIIKSYIFVLPSSDFASYSIAS